MCMHIGLSLSAVYVVTIHCTFQRWSRPILRLLIKRRVKKERSAQDRLMTQQVKLKALEERQIKVSVNIYSSINVCAWVGMYIELICCICLIVHAIVYAYILIMFYNCIKLYV